MSEVKTKKPINVDKRLYNVPEVAEALRVHSSHVYRMLDSGELASIKIGKRRLVRVEAIDAFIDAHAA
jgi:excisionase family DNA binding protein